MIKFFRHITRIIIAAALCLLALKYFHLNDFGNILMFMGIYIGVSLMLEPLFNKIEQKYIKNKKK
jgi:hypothetical protein